MSKTIQSLQPAPRIPRATYRLQFNENFRLPDALALVPYLHDLGISHIYASPILKAAPHSMHGYDVCDWKQLNPQLGTETDLENLVAALHEREMYLVLDIVPNHMGIASPENRWWWDVLAHGQASRFANYFDIDWQSNEPDLRGKVLVPVLADSVEEVLARGEFKVETKDDGLILRYFDQQFPLTLPQAATVAGLNSDPKSLAQVIGQQNYLLAPWTRAEESLNYRRFFNVNTLAGLRIEDEKVFNATHALIGKWVKKGWVDGLRVDHPDGLRDPGQYLQRLRALAPNAWIVIEKILQPEESPTLWPVEGSTGYDFLNRVAGVFIETKGEKPFAEFYHEFTSEPGAYGAMVIEKKRNALRNLLGPETNRLTDLLMQIEADANRQQLREALIELAVHTQVYRTYICPEQGIISETDVAQINKAAALARSHRPDLAPANFDFLHRLLLLKQRGPLADDFVARFQQLTGPAMAKGVEDTVFFCFNRFAGLNEVGGDPSLFGLSASAFHEACHYQQSCWPNSMLSTSTHDTKRSEDVRARLALLSEIPASWRQAVRQWSDFNEIHRQNNWPDRNAEYLLYQTLVGAWPLPLDRALAYMEKAVSEAQQHTTWTRKNAEYLHALKEFIKATIGDVRFRNDLESFMVPLVEAGYVNSLSQTLIKLTAPGVPDIYQGCDLWDFSLVDPDNRRPVDFHLRQHFLGELKTMSVQDIWRRRIEGLPKLWLTWKTLSLRARRTPLFASTSKYKPLIAEGAKSDHVIAFTRGSRVITVVQRLPLSLGGNWADTTLKLPPGQWRNELGDAQILEGTISLAFLLREFPVALLMQEEK